jgi:hypothetical protein
MAEVGPIDGGHPALPLGIVVGNAFRAKLIRLALIVLVVGVQSEDEPPCNSMP